ncbi:MAG: thioredoxin family protein [Bacteroidales bacterium]|jgi:peroxiredoxin|nr:thioredoxin family protein [Lentimicrobiaceae bacterium]MDG1136485.1 thioredoxin family protein [Bacteroidales bacterium]MDG1902614.1 thioredoxin family protein [Bacteroidales bacterium]MDG2081823.1 thioredoxin family protein [Bacteroidales bacterium]|tara:strand:+ start:9806 stop:10360 length:555 start_codon:yes stop_codon:yes gene_type:complete
MSLTFTNHIPLGFKLPYFNLLDTITGEMVSSIDIKGKKGTLVIFMCNHCPYVLHVIHELVKIGYEFMNQGIGIVAISANDVENYPEDHPSKMKELGLSLKFPFPYLYDETQEVAKLYDAACTPDFNLFDKKGNCVYRGQLDESRPGNDKSVTGSDLRIAMELVVKGSKVPINQIPSCGCNIKWK